MRKLPAVEEAREVMTQGMKWGVLKWLMEKKRVRQIADRATDALNESEMKVKAAWSEEFKAAYDVLLDKEAKPKRTRTRSNSKANSRTIDPEILATVRDIKKADDEAEEKRLDAEDTFEQAERSMSTSGAREGARKALETYDLHEKAIRKAEAVLRAGKTTA
jgi:hypothetical protein